MGDVVVENKDSKVENIVEKFVHLHVHSYFSLLDGFSSPMDLAKCAKELGFKSLAITDHGSCGGLFKFQKACISQGIKPIMGMEGYSCDDHESKEGKIYHIVLLVKNAVGLGNLMRLATEAELKGKYRKPRIDFSLLEKYHEGLIVTSACPAGEVSILLNDGNIEKTKSVISKYKKLFGDDYYIEIMEHEYFADSVDGQAQQAKEKRLSNDLYLLAKEMGVKAIATNDIHYARKTDSKYHDILLSMQTRDVVKNPDRFTFCSSDFYMKSYDEMALMYKDRMDLLENTVEIANKITNEPLFNYNSDLLPEFKVPEGVKDEPSYLKELVKAGMIQKGFMNNPVYRERIRFEMDVIIKCGYTRYFLILWDVINFAKQNSVAFGCGRGSAVGSLALYVLGVTGVDPIKYDLLFERFLNPDRVSPPDVDMDFDDKKRPEIISYVTRKYGEERCCKIGTYQAYKARSIVRNVVKALDFGRDWENLIEARKKNPNAKLDESKNSLRLADYIAKLIPEGSKANIEDAYKSEDEFRREVDKYSGLYDILKKMEKTLGSSGVHASGYVVCKDPIHEHVAIRNSKGQICCQFEGPEVEELGLLKFDFLGLKTITVIDKTLAMIRERYGKDIDLEKIEPDDQKVFSLFNGKYKNYDLNGIFQFESYGMNKLLKEINVDSFNDIVVANALYRPATLRQGIHTDYCNSKHKVKVVKPLHPKMSEILSKTYSLMIFQEDMMKISRELAGFTRGQSDTLRKAAGKKNAVLMGKQRELFVQGCAKNNISESVANEIFSKIESFGEYGFNLSHSTSYGMMAYYCGYLKIYYPIEFMCNLLSSEQDEDKLGLYLKQAMSMGVVVKTPNINKSGLEYKIERGVDAVNGKEYDYIRAPFTSVKGIGDKSVDNIVINQPYPTFKDFVSRIDSRKVTCRVVEALLDVGAMDLEWKMTRKEILSQYEVVKSLVSKEKKEKSKQEEYTGQFGSGCLFDAVNDESNIDL